MSDTFLVVIILAGLAVILVAALWGTIALANHLDYKRAEEKTVLQEQIATMHPSVGTHTLKRYVECIHSRFPLYANRWAYVTTETVSNELLKGRLDPHGMERTYASLGCGALF